MQRRDPEAEARLVRPCAAGEESAWTEFVDGYGPLLTSLARRMLARRTGRAHDVDVDEVVAEVFLALLRRERILLHRYDPTYRLSTYLGVITRTEVLRHLRRGNRLPRDLEEPELVADASGGLAPARRAEEAERLAVLAAMREALAELPDRDRRLLTLRYLEGRDYRDIGATLGLNPESIGQFLTRAKARLARRVPHLATWIATE